jgi:hypothetical protein
MDADEGVAVAALVSKRQVERQRLAPGTLADHRRSRREHVRQPDVSSAPIRAADEYGGSRKTRS